MQRYSASQVWPPKCSVPHYQPNFLFSQGLWPGLSYRAQTQDIWPKNSPKSYSEMSFYCTKKRKTFVSFSYASEPRFEHWPNLPRKNVKKTHQLSKKIPRGGTLCLRNGLFPQSQNNGDPPPPSSYQATISMHEIQASPQERREDEDSLSWGGRRENRSVINLWGFIPGKGDFFSECCWVRRRGELNKATCFAGRGGKRGTWEREKKKKRKLEFKRSNYDSSLMHICTGVFMQLYAFLPKSPHKKVQKKLGKRNT